MKSFFNRAALEAVHKECLDLGARKNQDYGQAGDAIALAGLSGVVVRMLDKEMRLLSLTKPGYEAKVKDESIRDTLLDMINYASYGVLLLDGTWGVEGAVDKDWVLGAPEKRWSADAYLNYPDSDDILKGSIWDDLDNKAKRGRKAVKITRLKSRGISGKEEAVGYEEHPIVQHSGFRFIKDDRPKKKAKKKVARKK